MHVDRHVGKMAVAGQTVSCFAANLTCIEAAVSFGNGREAQSLSGGDNLTTLCPGEIIRNVTLNWTRYFHSVTGNEDLLSCRKLHLWPHCQKWMQRFEIYFSRNAFLS